MKDSTLVRLRRLTGWSTVAVALGLCVAMGAQAETYHDPSGAYGAYLGPVGAEYAGGVLALWACPEDLGAEIADSILGCPVDMTPAYIRPAGEDTRDGGYLTSGMVQRMMLESPGTDERGCRYHDTGYSTVITCDDGTYLEWS